MPLPPYDQLLQRLSRLISYHPDFAPTLQTLIEYLQDTRQNYENWVLKQLDSLDDEDEDEDYYH